MLGPVFRLGSTSSGGGGTVSSPGLTAFKFPIADAAQDLIDSKLNADTAASNNIFFAGRSLNIGPAPAAPSAVLQADSTLGGVLVPRMLAAQKNAIAAPATGLLVYETDAAPGFWFWNGAAWTHLSTASGTVTSSGMTITRIPKATTAQNIEDSNIQELPSGVVGINGTPDVSAVLTLTATDKGFLVPRMTNAQRAAIPTPATGLLVYCTNAVAGFYVYDGASWVFIGAGSGTVTSSGMFANKVAVASAAQNIETHNFTWLGGDGWSFGAFSNVQMQQLQGQGGTPTPSVLTVRVTSAAVVGSDLAGNVTIVFNSPSSNTALVKITFNLPYSAAPRCVIFSCSGGSNVDVDAACVHVDNSSITANDFTISSGNVVTGLSTNTFVFSYIVIQ